MKDIKFYTKYFLLKNQTEIKMAAPILMIFNGEAVHADLVIFLVL